MRPKGEILVNSDERFKEFGKDFEYVESITLQYPTLEEQETLSNIEYEWRFGDRWEIVADRFYGDRRYWIALAQYNLKPTDFHCKPGDIIEIPSPIGRLLEFMGL